MPDDDLILANKQEQYCDLLLRVAEAAQTRGLTFREVMTLMARRALDELAIGVPEGLATCEPALPAVVRPNAIAQKFTPRRPESVATLIQTALDEADRPLSAKEISARLPALEPKTIKVTLYKHRGVRWRCVELTHRRVVWASEKSAQGT